jgi:hypothetical protein
MNFSRTDDIPCNVFDCVYRDVIYCTHDLDGIIPNSYACPNWYIVPHGYMNRGNVNETT